MFVPSIFVGLEPFPPSPPGCDSTCQLGRQMFFVLFIKKKEKRQLIEN